MALADTSRLRANTEAGIYIWPGKEVWGLRIESMAPAPENATRLEKGEEDDQCDNMPFIS